MMRRLGLTLLAAAIAFALLVVGVATADAAFAISPTCNNAFNPLSITSPQYYGYAYSGGTLVGSGCTNPSNGNQTPSFSVSSGSLPSGWSLSATHNTGGLDYSASISGYASPGTYSFTLKFSNGYTPYDKTQSFTITVYGNPSFTAVSPPNGINGVGYSYTFQANNNANIQLSSGSLPPGLTLGATSGTGNTAAVLSGTPTTSAVYSFTLSAVNASNSDTRNLTVTIGTAPVFTAASPASTLQASSAYSYTFAASGSPAPTFAVSSGTLPTGLTLTSAGVLSGTPTATGTFTYVVSATNVFGTATASVTTVVGNAPAFTASSPPSTAVQNAAYSYTFVASGIPPSAFSLSSGSLPPGLTLSSSGVLSGTPTTLGTSSFTVTASNGVSPSAVTGSISILVGTVPVFTAASPPNSVVNNSAYSYLFAASGSPSPTLALTAGAVPTGMTFTPATGKLTGTPTAIGTFTFTVTATNAIGSASQPVTVVVGTVPLITAANPTSPVAAHAAYSYTFTASGSPSPTFALSSGALPAGLSLSSAGVLSGTPTTVSSSTFAVTATNSFGTSAPSSVTVIVGTAPAFTAAAPPSTGAVNTAYSYTYSATGSPQPTFAVSSGSLPPGLTLSSSGVLSGTPTTLGTSSFTVTASNGVSPSAVTGSTSILIGAAPAFTAASPPNGVVGAAYSYTFVASGSPTPTLSSSSLPTGFTFTPATGVLSGSSSSVTSFSFTVTATNAFGTLTTTSLTVAIGVVPVITAANPPSPAAVNSPYSYTFTASGSPSPTFAVSSGSLPAGLSLSSAGVLSGTPTTVSSSTFAVTATNSVGTSAPSPVTIVVGSIPIFTAASPTSPARVGVGYSYTFTASGSPAPTFTLTSGALPTGLSLSSSGVVSGTPTVTGISTFNVTATNSLGSVQSSSLTVEVDAAPTLTASTPPSTAQVGVAYSYTYIASGFPAPTFAVSSGSLPSGVSLNATTGLLSGSPALSGSYTFAVVATNSVSSTTAVSATILVGSVPILSAYTPPSGQVAVTYSYSYVATGFPAPTFTVSSGVLPGGLTLSPGGVLSGIPTASGSFTFQVTASNGYAPAASSPATIAVAAAGVRTAFVAATELSPVRTSSSTQTSTGALTLWATDTTNTGAGWNVTVQSSAFRYSGPNGGSDIPASDFGVTSLGALSRSSGQPITTGTDAAPAGPQSANLSGGVSGALNVPLKIVTAAAGYGTGSYYQLINVSLGVPGNSKPGLYTATLTITIASGP